MSINISSFLGAGGQLFDDNGTPLVGGKLYSYYAGTTSLATTYTSKTGATNNTNPIVLDAGGRTPYEIWLTGGMLYKFMLYTATGVLVGTYDDIPAINDPTTSNTLITVSGTNALTAISSPPLAGYTAGGAFSFVVQNTNTGPVTIDIDGLGGKAITKNGTVPLAAGDLKATKIAIVEYDGTQFQLLNVPTSAFAYAILFGL